MSARTMLGWIALLGLAGCASGWTKEGVSGGQHRLDAYACAKDAGLLGMSLGLPDSEALFGQCMQGRGYERTPH